MKIALLGDIAIFGRYCITKNKSVFRYLDKVREHLSKIDIVIGNLEAPFATNENPIIGKSATVKSHPANIELLNYIRLTHVNLANNHIGDFGIKGYKRTKELLISNGIDWFGTEDKQIDLEICNEKISLLGFCSYNTNPSPVRFKSKNNLNYLDANLVYRKLKNNFDRGFFNIIAIHSGQEHIHLPSSEDVKFARKIANNFDYVYYGHHPHVIQAFEKVNGSAIFYSLGNFIFDDVFTPRDHKEPLIKRSEANKTGLIGEIEIQKGKLVNNHSTPIYMSEESMIVDNEIDDIDLDVYNSFVKNAGTLEYDRDRSNSIKKFIEQRREMRNLKWYVNRLNFNSVGILLKARKNLRLYQKHFLSKVDLIEEKK